MLNRVRTGIEGVDELVNGGFPRGQTILVTGGAGTGKSTFAMQYIYRGAKVYDEPGIYVSLEETIPSIRKNSAAYGWDVEALEKDQRISLVEISPAVGGQIRRIEPADVFSIVQDHWRKMGAKRIVIDPITVFGMQTDSPMQLRQDLIRFSSLLKQLETTILFVTEIPEDSQALSRYGVEEFISDGVVVLYYSRVGGLRVRGIEIRKMRGTAHKEGIFPIKIGDTGLAAYPSAKLPKTLATA
jgi:KaiC/GvpD/RAD55 family RecA-like ATPase